MRLRINTCCSDALVYIAAAAIALDKAALHLHIVPPYVHSINMWNSTAFLSLTHTLTSLTAKGKLSQINNVVERKTEIDSGALRSRKQQQN